ncbi:MAG: radical SAM protein [Anaerolineales bacterium]|jgi:MoaA/NifB/PqqE/SkfB family radical SAM enzyme
MVSNNPVSLSTQNNLSFPKKLWIYTNFDCNLRCSYCVAESSPTASRRALTPGIIQRLVDEAQTLEFDQIYFTGGEPFLLKEIYDLLEYSSGRVCTTVLTNAMLFQGKRLENLCAIKNDNLIVQVSLDGSCPEHHDPYRGRGSWNKTLTGIRLLQEVGFRVRISTTETPSNSAHLAEICKFHLELGIPEKDHIIRPLAKRGFSNDGMLVGKHNLSPEITVSVGGVYWHPLSTDPDMQLADQILPLSEAICLVRAELEKLDIASQAQLCAFK